MAPTPDWVAIASTVASTASALATIYYVKLTNTMATAMKLTYDLDNRPYLAFQGLSIAVLGHRGLISPNTIEFDFHINLANNGKLIANYEVSQFSLSVEGVENIPEHRPYWNGGTLFPGNSGTYHYPPIQINSFNNFPINGRVSIGIEYGPNKSQRTYKVWRDLKFTIYKLENDLFKLNAIIMESDDT